MQKRGYAPDEVDAVAAYCLELNRCFYFPMSWMSGRTFVQLRLAPSRNNQRKGINWADDFDFERLQSVSLGAITQLGERLRGTQEVGGSSPPGSIGSDGTLFVSDTRLSQCAPSVV